MSLTVLYTLQAHGRQAHIISLPPTTCAYKEGFADMSRGGGGW